MLEITNELQVSKFDNRVNKLYSEYFYLFIYLFDSCPYGDDHPEGLCNDFE